MGRPSETSSPLVIPGLLLLLLLAAISYNLYLAKDGERLRREVSSLQLRILERRELLRSLEAMEQERKASVSFPPSAWAPMLANPLEARVLAERRVMDAMRDVKVTQPNLEWKEEPNGGLRRASVTLKALFPSYEVFMRCLRGLEEGFPPLLPQSLEIKKEGMRIRVTLTLAFHYRLRHEGV